MITVQDYEYYSDYYEDSEHQRQTRPGKNSFDVICKLCKVIEDFKLLHQYLLFLIFLSITLFPLHLFFFIFFFLSTHLSPFSLFLYRFYIFRRFLLFLNFPGFFFLFLPCISVFPNFFLLYAFYSLLSSYLQMFSLWLSTTEYQHYWNVQPFAELLTIYGGCSLYVPVQSKFEAAVSIHNLGDLKGE